VQRFLHIEASGGLLLVTAAVVALVWANSPWAASYRDLWTAEFTLDLGGHAITEDFRHWINDGLMTLFFFVLGLEIKEELTNGLLTRLKDAAVPAAGALGGMVVPAGLFLALNLGGEGVGGWESRWPPMSRSRSGYWPCSGAGYRPSSRSCSSPSRSSMTSGPSS
jgi:NhaA family Na+:H+ antiporter